MLHIALAFFFGDACLQAMPTLPYTWQGCVAYLSAVLLVVAPLCIATRKRPALRNSIVAFALGWIWAGGHAVWQLQQDINPELEGRDITVVGRIVSLPQRESYGWRFNFAVESAAAGQPIVLPPQIELSWYARDHPVHAAERWQLQVRLKRRHGFANPGSYDYEGQLFREGIGATGYVRASADTQYLGLAQGEYVLKVRAYLAERIAAAVPDAPMQGVIRGLAVGDQQAISGAQWQVFSRTGISHLIAISGSHIGMVGLLAAWFGGLLVHVPWAQRRRLTRPHVRAVFGLTAATAYSLLAGMSVPTQRTLAMLAVYFATQWLRRHVSVWHSFGLALLLCLLLDPFASLAIGTWLSFGAVAVILLNQQGRLRKDHWWREFLTLQVAVSIGLTPFLLTAFGNISLVAPLVNLIAIPLFTVVLVPAVLLSCSLLLIHALLGTWCLQVLADGLDVVFSALKWAAQLPLATWYFPTAPSWAIGLLVVGALVMIVPILWPMRFCGLLCFLPALLWQPDRLPADSFELTVLDVGQGLAVVIRTRTHVLLYDTGPKFQSGTDTGQLVVLPYLHAQGVRRVDVMMISHGDDDHAGGMESVHAGMPVDALLLGPSVRTPMLHTEGQVQRCARGQHWQWDGVEFEVEHPAADDLALSANKSQKISDNNTSCVLRIAVAGGSALLLGDAEKPVEQQLVVDGLIPPTDIVVAGHHGSRSSSTAELVVASHAREVIFSAGYRNRWDFPQFEVVHRWQQAGARTDSTIESGAVSVLVTPLGLDPPQAYRKLRRRYWQAN